MSEIFDRVNEKDEVVGTTSKMEAHENGYAHRVAAVFVFNKENQLLVQRRKKDGFLDHSVGGHLRSGETYDEAAVREFKEELGLSSSVNKIGVFYADERVPGGKHQVVHYFGLYESRPSDDELNNMVLSEDEVIEMIPMAIEEIAKSMINEPEKWTTGFMSTMNFYVKQKGLDIPLIPLK